MTTTSTPTVRLFGSFSTYTQLPQNFHFDVYVATREEAEQIAASFPKSAKMLVTTVYSRSESKLLPGHTGDFYGVQAQATLTANGSNGGVNETGVRRYRTIVKTIAKLGMACEWMGEAYSNSYPTQEAFEAALDAS